MDKGTKLLGRKSDKQPNKISKSGRAIKRSQKVITSSSDEAPRKKSKPSLAIDKELLTLKQKLSNIQEKRSISKTVPTNSTSKPTDSTDNSGESNCTSSQFSNNLISISDGTSSKAILKPKPISINDVKTSLSSLIKNSKPPPCSNKDSLKNNRLSQPQVNEYFEPLTPFEVAIEEGEIDYEERPGSKKMLPGSDDTFHETSENVSKTAKPIIIQTEILKDALIPVTTNLKTSNPSSSKYSNIIAPDFELLQNLKEHDFSNCFQKVIERLDVTIAQNEKILAQQSQILAELLQNRNNSEKELSQTLLTPLAGFPKGTVEEFQEINSDENKNIRKKIHDHLVKIGGFNIRHFLASGLKQFMTDELVCSFTWNGDQNSSSFKDTRIANVFYQSAIKCSNFDGPANKEVFKGHMLEVMRLR